MHFIESVSWVSIVPLLAAVRAGLQVEVFAGFALARVDDCVRYATAGMAASNASREDHLEMPARGLDAATPLMLA